MSSLSVIWTIDELVARFLQRLSVKVVPTCICGCAQQSSVRDHGMTNRNKRTADLLEISQKA